MRGEDWEKGDSREADSGLEVLPAPCNCHVTKTNTNLFQADIHFGVVVGLCGRVV